MVLLSVWCVWHQADVRSAAQVAWTPVVLTDARTHLASLTPETCVEQLRDFALLAAYVQAEEPAERANGLVTFQPLRLDFLGDLAGHRAGASRWMTLHRGGLLVVVPEASKDAAARLVTIGRAADEYRALHGTQPARTRAFLYRIDAVAAPPRLEVAPINEIASVRLFTADAGYREAQVQTAAQLDAFLAANLDLVLFQVEGASIRVGGRAHASGVPRLITTGDLAVIDRASRTAKTTLGFSLDPRVNFPEIAATLRAAARGDQTKFAGWLEAEHASSIAKSEAFRSGGSGGGATDREINLATLLGLTTSISSSSSSSASRKAGAGRDPRASAIAAEVASQTKGTIAALRAIGPRLERVATALDARNVEPLLELQRDLARQQQNEPVKQVRAFIDRLEQARNYQCARYDGDFQGTEVGMTLFYTDLIMKLWGFSNAAQTPPVEGFIPKTQFAIDPIHREGIIKFPETRMWLGGRLDAIAMTKGGASLFFAPIATRLYNASSDPLRPGKEEPANFMSERFSSWWNFHYREVADHEPQYHRLNQIMKWSVVLQKLGASHTELFTRLIAPAASTPAARRDLRFDRWWPGRTDLKVRWKLRFVTPSSERTECLALVESDLFDVMDHPATLSGGVSLFNPSDLAVKPQQDAARFAVSDPRHRVAAGDFQKVAIKGPVMEVPLANGGALVRSGPGVSGITLPAGQALTGNRSSLNAPGVGWQVQRTGEGLRITVRDTQSPLGNLDVTPSGGRLAFRVEESAVTGAVRILNSSSAGQQSAEARAQRAAEPMLRVLLPTGDVLFRHGRRDEWAIARAPKNVAASEIGVRVQLGNQAVLVRAIGSEEIARALGPGQVARLGEWLPPGTANGLHGVIFSKSGAAGTAAGLKVTADGYLQLPIGADAATVTLARRIARLTAEKPGLAIELYRLPEIAPKDIDLLATYDNTMRAIRYMDMRALPANELGKRALTDFGFTQSDPRIIARIGNEIRAFPIQNAAAVIRANEAVKQLMEDKGLPRTWSLKEFREKTRPLYDLIEQMRIAANGRDIVSLEDGPLSIETLYRMHGGKEGFRIYRDNPDLRASVRHVDAPPVLRLDRSVFLSTASLDEDDGGGAGAAGAGVDARLAAVLKLASALRKTGIATSQTAATFDTLRAVLNDERWTQITLVARCRDGGLLFADRRVSAEELAEAARAAKPKDYLHLITDCGMSAVSAFADTGRFGRVLSTRFVQRDVPSFERALQNVTNVAKAAASNRGGRGSGVTIDRAIEGINAGALRQSDLSTRNAFQELNSLIQAKYE